MNKSNIKKQISFGAYLNEQLKKPGFKKVYDEEGKQLEVAYEILQLRKKQGISQSELAKKIGTTQSNIARIEAGKQNLTVNVLAKIAKALNRELVVRYT